MSETSTAHRLGVLGWSPGEGGVHYFRIAEPLRVLAEAGYRTLTSPIIDNDILGLVDTVLAHTVHTEGPSQAWEQLARGESHRLVLDVDDAMWWADLPRFREHYTPERLALLFRNVELAHVVTTPSPVIAEHLSRYNRNVHVVPNTIPAWLLEHTMPEHPPTIGYQGSDSHIRDWTQGLTNQLARFLAHHPDWAVHTYGPLYLEGGHSRYQHTGWVDGVEGYWRTAAFDIGLGPLRDTRFNKAKSGLRAVEYAALGIVAVLPDLPLYRPWVDHGETGWLVKSHETYRGVLEHLARSPYLLQEMARNARAAAARWTTEAQIERWLDAWHSR